MSNTNYSLARTIKELKENPMKATNTEPEVKKIGTMWFDGNERVIKYWTGTEWIPFGAAYL